MINASEKAAYLDMLQGKINTLQFLGQNLGGCKVQIQITLDCGSKVLLEQNLIPFNLAMELRLLIDESIDEYQRQHKNIADHAHY